MPIVDKRDRNNWYNCIPIKRDPAERWKRFSADQLKGNEVECGCGTLAKIPQIKGLISFKNRENEFGRVTRYVELITERRYDKEKKQSRNKRVCIGIDISHIYPGMMIINEKYHNYFNKNGDLIFSPRIEVREEKKKTKEKKEQNQDQSQDAGLATQAPEAPPAPAESETIREEAKEEEQMDGKDQEIQEELDRQEHLRHRFGFLDRMLRQYKLLVDEQLSKKQDRKMSRYQIRRINELLQDIRAFLQAFEYTEYLQLAEEAEEESGDRMSYSDMAILLSGYMCVMDSYRYGEIWYKG